MCCEGKLKLRSHNTSYCLIEMFTCGYLHVEQELLTLPVPLSSPRLLVGIVLFYLVFYVIFCILLCVLLSFFVLSLYCLSFSSIDSFWLPLWYLLITPLVSSDYLFGIFWLLLWYLLITPLVSSDYSFSIFWLLIWFLLITSLVSSNYSFGIFKPLLLMGFNFLKYRNHHLHHFCVLYN